MSSQVRPAGRYVLKHTAPLWASRFLCALNTSHLEVCSGEGEQERECERRGVGGEEREREGEDLCVCVCLCSCGRVSVRVFESLDVHACVRLCVRVVRDGIPQPRHSDSPPRRRRKRRWKCRRSSTSARWRRRPVRRYSWDGCTQGVVGTRGTLSRAMAGGGPMARMRQGTHAAAMRAAAEPTAPEGALAEYRKGVGASPAADDALLVCASASISLRATRRHAPT